MATQYIELPDGNVVAVEDEDMAAFEQEMQKQFPPPAEPTALDNLPTTLKVGSFDTGVELPQGAAKFLVGAGRTFDQMYKGAQQLIATGEADEELRQAEAHDRALYADLDDMGIGFEDLGELAPEILASLAPAMKVAQLATTPTRAGLAILGGGAAGGAGVEAVRAEAVEGETEQRMLAGAIGGGLGAGLTASISAKFIKNIAGLGASHKATNRRRFLRLFDRSTKAHTMEQQERAIREAGLSGIEPAQAAARAEAIQQNRRAVDKLYSEEIVPTLKKLSQHDKMGYLGGVAQTFRDMMPDALQSPTPGQAIKDAWGSTFGPLSNAEINREFKRAHGKAIIAVGDAIDKYADELTASEIELAVKAASGEMGEQTAKAVAAVADQPIGVVKRVLSILAGQEGGAQLAEYMQ